MLNGSAVPSRRNVESFVVPPFAIGPAARGTSLVIESMTGWSGAAVSTVMVVTAEAVLGLPAASVKAPAGTLTVPLVVELAKGVKTTV